jgi:fluoroquinolone resistance protein
MLGSRGATFLGGSLRNARITQARFAGADLRDADLGGLRLADLGALKGATISTRHAAELLREFGVNVG